jgi:hypothetical protein
VTGTFDNWSGNTHKLDKEGSVHSTTVQLEPTTEKILYKVSTPDCLVCFAHPSSMRWQAGGSIDLLLRPTAKRNLIAESNMQTRELGIADLSFSSSLTASGDTIPLTTQKPTEPAT